MQHAVIFPLVTISATTLCSWFWFAAVADKCKSAVTISGLTTYIAANQYMRIFNSWMEGGSHTDRLKGAASDGSIAAPALTGPSLSEAYLHRCLPLRAPLQLVGGRIQLHRPA